MRDKRELYQVIESGFEVLKSYYEAWPLESLRDADMQDRELRNLDEVLDHLRWLVDMDDTSFNFEED